MESALATTCFFESELTDADSGEKITFEFGRSSHTGDSLLYINLGDKSVLVSEAEGRKIVEAMQNLGRYLSYDKAA
jgi:hypothetical protein